MEYRETKDGSLTLFSKQYNQSYHSCDDGALSESLQKHVIPAFTFSNKQELYILDICFGLGYNTLATLFFIKENNLNTKVHIFSPELDANLINSLKDFEYPKSLSEYKNIINSLIETNYYKSDSMEIELFIGDGREYIKNLDVKIDIVYQDAFSSDVNHELWTQEYFADIVKLLSNDAIITTYSIATPVRLAMSENNLNIYEYQSTVKKRSTIASMVKISDDRLKYIDMEKKKINNPNARALVDNL